MITRAGLDVSVDPGHGGLSFSYLLERRGADIELRAVVRRHYPPPTSMLQLPPTLDEPVTRTPAEADEFLRVLAGHGDVLALGDLESTTGMLHPTFYRFRFADEAGRVNEFRYRIECGQHLDSPHATLVHAFEQFFDQRRLAERFRGHAVTRTLEAPRPWWRFWARR